MKKEVRQLREKAVSSLVLSIDHLGLRQDDTYFKEFKIGDVKHSRYSPRAVEKMKDALAVESIDEIWAAYRERQERTMRGTT